MNDMEIRTPKQRERSIRNQKIASVYDTLKNQHPEARPSRLIAAMAENKVEGLGSPFAIREALIRTGRIDARPSFR